MLFLTHSIESEGATSSMEKYQRLESGTGWLIALGGLGVDYMTGGFSYLGLIVSAVGIAILIHRFWGELRRLRLVLVSGDNEQAHISPPREMLLALALIPLALCITVYVFYSSFSPSPVAFTGPFIVQESPLNSPNFTGAYSHNEFTINQEIRRQLGGERKENLRRVLLALEPHGVIIGHESGDNEAHAFADSLVSLFRSIPEWKVNGSNTIVEIGKRETGVLISVSEDTEVPQAVTILMDSLEKEGIACLLKKRKPTPENYLNARVFAIFVRSRQ